MAVLTCVNLSTLPVDASIRDNSDGMLLNPLNLSQILKFVRKVGGKSPASAYHVQEDPIGFVTTYLGRSLQLEASCWCEAQR